jgi:acetyl esterase/lipase
MRISVLIAAAAMAGMAHAAPPEPKTFPLYDAAPKGWEHPAQVELTESWPPPHRMLRNVATPTLTAFLPDPAKATGTGVLVIPGGGFVALSIDEEGNEVALWLADHGVAAFVLKYRLGATPPDQKAFFDGFTKMLGGKFDPNARSPNEAAANEDGAAALALIKGRAASFSVDPAKVGVLGFSAGGIMALHLGMDPAAHPAFVGDIYAPVRSGETVPPNAPPLFSALAADDPLFGKVTTSSFEAWRAAGRPAELHVYEKGGHGFGTRKQGTTSDGWLGDFYRWLVAHGWAKAAG